ncbi:beta-glucosidase [Peterkaempfera sp. SMS 1(5)a]|uniref:beta-glucosidase family protein n=1 Tax=Peterkaempfera podocarpi TaxID=3232308 RepID=UPI00366FDEA7
MTAADQQREAAVETALAQLDLDTKAGLLAGQDMWTLPAVPGIGLASLVMSDGPVGVRGSGFSPDDPSIALPSPTALAATWDPELARRAGRLLAQEARRKGVHVLLAPTVNLHRTPLGGRHFECYSEDPLLTGEIAVGYVSGVQEGGVATTVKHFVANDAETARMTVSNEVDERTLREMYLSPFEAVVRRAGAWGVMAAYNAVNGTTMTEHTELQNAVLKEEWGFDGFIVSDWTAGRNTVAAANGGLDVAMPGPVTVYGPALAQAVRDGRVAESVVDDHVRRLLRLAARVGALAGAPAAVTGTPAAVPGAALAREVASRSFVLVRNEDGMLPIRTEGLSSVALIGAAARDARVLGGGSAQVFPDHVVSPLDGLRAALPEQVRLSYALGADPSEELAAAGRGFSLRAVARDAKGGVLGETALADGSLQWFGALPEGIDRAALHSVEITGTFTADESGAHRFGSGGVGEFVLTVAGQTLFEGFNQPSTDDPVALLIAETRPQGVVELEAGETVEVGLRHTVVMHPGFPLPFVGFTLGHGGPEVDADTALEEAVAAAAAADVAVVVVATTSKVESEGIDRADLRLPGRQDELVRRVAAANPRTVVVVNSGSPVEMEWRDEVAAVLLSWFPGQECGDALADVLLGLAEPGGRLPTTWPVSMADCPVLSTEPVDGRLPYEEGVFIGYRGWERSGTAPAYWFGHGLGYTAWQYETAEFAAGSGDDLGTLRVRLRNTGSRTGREVVQVYLSAPDAPAAVERPARWLAGFASVEAAPGEAVEAEITLPRRAVQVWDGGWRTVTGGYLAEAAHSCADRRLTVPFTV